MELSQTPTTPDVPQTVAPLLTKIDEELRLGRTAQAVELLRRADTTSPWVANAMGVCQLRQGEAHLAVDTFRRLAVAGHLRLSEDAPVVFKTNFATAMLLTGNLRGCVSTLEEIGQDGHPAVARLRSVLGNWQKSLSFWERMNWYLGGEPGRPVPCESPGDLW